MLQIDKPIGKYKSSQNNRNPFSVFIIFSFLVLRVSIELKFYWDHNSFGFSYSNFDDLVFWWKLCYFDLFLLKIKSTIHIQFIGVVSSTGKQL